MEVKIFLPFRSSRRCPNYDEFSVKSQKAPALILGGGERASWDFCEFLSTTNNLVFQAEFTVFFEGAPIKTKTAKRRRQ